MNLEQSAKTGAALKMCADHELAPAVLQVSIGKKRWM